MPMVLTGSIVQKVVSSVHHLNTFSRFVCTAVNGVTSAKPKKQRAPKVVDKESIPKPSKTTETKARKEELRNCILTNLTQVETELLPKRYSTFPSKIPSSGYLISSDVAVSIQKILQNQNLDVNASVIEINPGLGILTKQIAGLGFTNVTLFEEDSVLAERLSNLWPKFSVVKKRFVRLNDLVSIVNDEEKVVADLLNKIQVSGNSENLYVTGVVPSSFEINFIVKSVVFSLLFYNKRSPWKKITYYFLLGPRVSTILTATLQSGYHFYRASSVLFQTIFDYEVLATFPRQSVLPWEKEPSENTRGKGAYYNRKIVHLIKFSVNQEKINQIGVDKLHQFDFFMKHNLLSRNNSVIPTLEKWIPNCGITLVRDGFTIFTQFGQLTPQELCDLYIKFISWPGFQDSSFLSAARKYYEEPDDTVHHDVEPLVVEPHDEVPHDEEPHDEESHEDKIESS